MPVDGTTNGKNATGVNDSFEDVVIKSFDIYGSNHPFSIYKSQLKSVYPQIYDFPQVWINQAQML